jgi:AraC family transcriptional activator of tynA and feaB
MSLNTLEEPLPQMTGIKTYTTDGLSPPQRVEYWNDWVGSHITAIETAPVDLKSFNGQLIIGDCASVTIADATSTPACNTHLGKLANRASDRALLLHLQEAGQSLNSQDGRQVLLRKGDFTLCDSARQFDVSFNEPHQILVVRIPERELTRRLPYIENLMCIPMPRDSGINGVIADLISKYWKMCRDGLDPCMQERISTNILDLLATAYSDMHNASVAESCLVTSRRLLIKEFIERHLNHAELSPSHIAGRFGYATSYIHLLFKGENESISHYILRRRLEEASKVLSDERFANRTIGEIACDWGFNSLTHFGRAFKRQFGVTPREFRERHRNSRGR